MRSQLLKDAKRIAQKITAKKVKKGMKDPKIVDLASAWYALNGVWHDDVQAAFIKDTADIESWLSTV